MSTTHNQSQGGIVARGLTIARTDEQSWSMSDDERRLIDKILSIHHICYSFALRNLYPAAPVKSWPWAIPRGSNPPSHFGCSEPKFVFRNYTPHAEELKEFVVRRPSRNPSLETPSR